MRPRRSVVGAAAGRGRKASTIEDASALVPMLIIRPPRSLRLGQVAVIAQPPLTIPSSRVSQPDEVVPSSDASDCLKAYQTVIGKSGLAPFLALAKTLRNPFSKNCRAPSFPL